MKIQINQSGAWRNFLDVEDDRERIQAIGHALLPLARELGAKAKFRAVDVVGDVFGYLEAPDFEWRKPGWKEIQGRSSKMEM